MSTKKTTELAAVNGFEKLANMDMAAMIAEELDGLDAGFERIKLPSAGATVFEVPDENGEPDAVKEFTAVILHHHPLNAYYKSEYTGGNAPPDCGSFDGVTGTGGPGGDCKSCPMNQFGSGKNGAKACQNRRRIYVLREGELFPLLLSLPTGSLRELTKYIKRLLSQGRKSNSVVTKFSLKKATNTTGIAYSQAQFTVERELTDAEQALINPLTEQVKVYSQNVGFEVDVAESESETADGAFVNVDANGEIVEPLQ